ncbi:MAG: DUF177 domain-containing protein [Schleiferiaceae bacterium]|jgi:uncharacterized metal-binding protein YceD (DUF177 family)|nr:DUF177 domain-containing protein [Schleiferiaceae bacterium]
MKLKDFNIVFSGLKLGTHHFDYQLDQRFFDLFDFDEMENPNLNVEVEFEKMNNMLELDFSLNGEYTALCDVTGKPFQLPVSNAFHLVVKFGAEYNDENEEILVLPFESYEVNIAQFVYELAVLSIPQKKIHPDVESGNIDEETEALLNKYKLDKEPEEGDEQESKTDPRWDKLKDLLDK